VGDFLRDVGRFFSTLAKAAILAMRKWFKHLDVHRRKTNFAPIRVKASTPINLTKTA
jgi:hypothetical protein